MNDDILLDEIAQDVSMEHKLWFNHNWLFHVSKKNVKTFHFKPQFYALIKKDEKPGQYKDVFKNGSNPNHICFSHSITNCIRALPFKPSKNENLYVYGLDISKWTAAERSKYIRRPDRKIYEFSFTQELWVLKPVDVPQIMVISPYGGNEADFSNKIEKREFFRDPKNQKYLQFTAINTDLIEKLQKQGLSKDEIKRRYHLTKKANINDMLKGKIREVLPLPGPVASKWRIIKVTADPSIIGKALYDKLVYMKDHAPWNNPLMKAVKQYKASKESLLFEYEQMEDLFDLSEQFAEYGQELLDTYDTISTLYHCLEKETNNEGISFISSLFGMEADTTAGAPGVDPTGKKPNTGSKAKTVNTAVLNAGSVMDKMKEFMRRVGQWIVEFFTKSTAYAQKLVAALTQKATEINNNKTNLNFKLNNLCYDINDVVLDNWIGRLDGDKSREELGQIYQELKDTLESKVTKEPREVPKTEVITLLQSYSAACNRVIGSKDVALNNLRNNIAKAKASQDAKEIKMIQGKATAVVNFANYFVRFIFRNTMKLLSLTTKNAFSGKQTDNNTSETNSSSANNTKDNTTGKSIDETLNL